MKLNPVIASVPFFALAAIALPAPVHAADAALDVDTAVRQAEGSSPDLKKLELAADSASWGRLEAWSGHLPHLQVNATHFFAAKYSKLGVNFGGSQVTFPSAFPQTDVTLEASLNVFDGLGTIHRIRAAGLAHDAAELEYEYAKFRLDERVKVRFYQALAADELAKVADQNIRTLEDHLKLVRVSERAGIGTRVDVLRIESQLEEAKAEKLLADDNVALSRRTLAEAMGVAQDTRELTGTLPVPDSKRVPADLSLDLQQRADYQAQSRREDSQESSRAAAASFWFPQVSLFASQDFYKYGDFDPAILPNDTFQNAHSVGLKLTWNLFDGGRSIARRAQASDAAEQAHETTRALAISAPNEFETWKRRYIYNAALYQARNRSVEKSQESVRLATLAVKAGTKTSTEALDAELDLFRARAGVIQAQIDAIEAVSRLELALGHTL
jgi:outer membrane protein TolC